VAFLRLPNRSPLLGSWRRYFPTGRADVTK
ncbi:MAG: hypothetical protein K0S86_5506, partial [Geminicoccaceae bacterium]|nr:hypothetical protein [Geminicoccaceae bacterium]